MSTRTAAPQIANSSGPMGTGNPTKKATWDDAELQVFQNRLDCLVAHAVEQQHVLDFTGVVFPTKVTYHI